MHLDSIQMIVAVAAILVTLLVGVMTGISFVVLGLVNRQDKRLDRMERRTTVLSERITKRSNEIHAMKIRVDPMWGHYCRETEMHDSSLGVLRERSSDPQPDEESEQR